MDNDFTKYLLAASKELGKPHSDVPDIKSSIVRLEKAISNLELQLESRSIRLKNVNHFQKTIDSLLCQVEEITKSLEQIHSAKKELANSSRTTSYFARDSNLYLVGNGVPGLESPCTRNLRETCELLSSYFMREYYSSFGLECEQPNGREKQVSKDELWTMAEGIARSYSSIEIQAAMVSNIQESTTNLNDLCSRIDLRRDADNLKFMFETGKLKDVSAKPMMMQTVQQLIEEGQVSHFKRFLESEKSKNQSWKLEKELEEINTKISQQLSKKFQNKEVAKISEMMLLEQEEKLLEKSIHKLQKSLVKMKAERNEKEQSMKQLHMKYNCIQNFDKAVQGKQLVIQRLIKKNGTAKSRHRQQQQDIVTMTEQKIVKRQSELPDLCHHFSESQEEEIEIFKKTPMTNLQTVKSITDRRQLVSNLSIHQISAKYKQPGEEHLSLVWRGLKIPCHAPSESIFPSVLEKVDELYKSQESNSDTTSDLSNAVSKLEGIKEKVFQSNEEDINAFLPTLNESQKKSHNILSQCIKFRNTVQQWWEQPAQHAAPWVKEGGANLSQYIEQFSSNASLMKKLQLVN